MVTRTTDKATTMMFLERPVLALGILSSILLQLPTGRKIKRNNTSDEVVVLLLPLLLLFLVFQVVKKAKHLHVYVRKGTGKKSLRVLCL